MKIDMYLLVITISYHFSKLTPPPFPTPLPSTLYFEFVSIRSVCTFSKLFSSHFPPFPSFISTGWSLNEKYANEVRKREWRWWNLKYRLKNHPVYRFLGNRRRRRAQNLCQCLVIPRLSSRLDHFSNSLENCLIDIDETFSEQKRVLRVITTYPRHRVFRRYQCQVACLYAKKTRTGDINFVDVALWTLVYAQLSSLYEWFWTSAHFAGLVISVVVHTANICTYRVDEQESSLA